MKNLSSKKTYLRGNWFIIFWTWLHVKFAMSIVMFSYKICSRKSVNEEEDDHIKL